MQALRLHETNQPLQLESLDTPAPFPGQALIRLQTAALNHRDCWIMQGLYPGLQLPITLGSDGAGIVQRVGEGVETSLVGEEVIMNPGLRWGASAAAQADDFEILGMPTDGTFATHVIVPASCVFPRPKHLSGEESASLPLAGVTAYRALFTRGQLQSGQNVLISGIGGGVATFALQFAVAAGADVWVTSSSAEKIERAVGLGAKGGFNYKDENWVKEFSETASAPNLIIDSAGGAGYAALMNLAAPAGRIVNYGATAGPPEKLDMFKLFWKQLRLQGSTMGSPTDFAAMLKFVNEKKLAPVVDVVTPLSEGNEAIGRMKSSPQFGKCVLSIE